ncbi:MAG: TRAP transporter small permease [Deltaproteobacteria bacterium]|nr:TRAP transporter small permease [Deltaproteobacteria bacterium]
MSAIKPTYILLKIFKSLSIYLAYIGAFSLFAMMCLTMADVLGRYIFNRPILGVFEITELMVLMLIFSFLGYTQAQKSHVSVDLFIMLFPERLTVLIEVFNHFICLAMMALIAWMGVDKALELMEAGEASPNLALPTYPFVFFLVLGCAVMCAEFIRDIIMFLKINKENADK